MLIVRNHRLIVVPAISLGIVALTTGGIVHGVIVQGSPAGPLLLGLGLPGLLCLAYAAFALRRIERRGTEISWGRLRLRASRAAARCELRGSPFVGGRAPVLTIELVGHGHRLADVTTVLDDGKADATAQRIADALELTYTRVPRASA